jgi:hypothetical protein
MLFRIPGITVLHRVPGGLRNRTILYGTRMADVRAEERRGMEVMPPRTVENFVRWLLPPTCVEHILGDLRERMEGLEARAARRQYVMDAIVTLPQVIFSRVFRRADYRLICLHLLLYAVAATGLFDPHHRGVHFLAYEGARMWWLALAMMVYKLFADAYSPSLRIPAWVKAVLILTLSFWRETGSAVVLAYGYFVVMNWMFEQFANPRGRPRA